MSLLKISRSAAAGLLLAISSASFAGVVNGGGGKGVVCRNADQSIKSVEVLDLWEAREMHNAVPTGMTGDLAKDVDAILNRLKASFSIEITHTSGPHGPVTCRGAECVLLELQDYAEPFLVEKDPKILRLRDVTLENTDDAMELVQPKSCGIEQIVNYQPPGGQILVNQDLVDKLDEANLASLIAHEAYYQVLKYHFGESTSIRVRRAIGYAVTGKDVVSPPELPFGKGQIVCESDPLSGPQEGQFPDVYANVVIVDMVNFKLEPRWIMGSVMLGLHPKSFDWSDERGKALLKLVFQDHNCETLGSGMTAVWRGNGPVEYDREIDLARSCMDHKSKITISVRKPGDVGKTTMKLTCKPLKKPFDI